MKKLQIPKIDRQDRVKCVLLAILGIAVEFVSLLCFSSGISGAVIVAVILLAASGAIGYFTTKRVIMSALCTMGVPVIIILCIALFILPESIEGMLLVLSVGLGYFSIFFALIFFGGLLAFAGRKIYVLIHRKRYGFDPADDFEDFSEEEEPSEDERKNIRHTNLLVCFLFFIAILGLNFLVFLLSIERAIEPIEPGGWFSQTLELVLINFVMTVLFLVLAIAIKLIFKKKIKVSILILCALIIPSLQTWGSFRAFDYGGILHSTIEEGGMFYQVCRLRNSTARNEIVISNDETFTKIEVKAYGRGSNFGCGLDYENREDEKEINVGSGYASKVEYFVLYLTPAESIDPEKLDFSCSALGNLNDNLDLTYEVLNDGRIKLTVLTDFEYIEAGRRPWISIGWIIKE
jgi:hypothetical protein